MTNDQAYFEMYGVHPAVAAEYHEEFMKQQQVPNVNHFDQTDQTEVQERNDERTHERAVFQSNNSGARFSVMTRKDDQTDIDHIESTMNCKFVRWAK